MHRVHCTQIGGAIPVTTICSSCRRDWLADNLLGRERRRLTNFLLNLPLTLKLRLTSKIFTVVSYNHLDGIICHLNKWEFCAKDFNLGKVKWLWNQNGAVSGQNPMKSSVLDIFIGHKRLQWVQWPNVSDISNLCNFKALLSLPSQLVFYGEITITELSNLFIDMKFSKIKIFSNEPTLDFETTGENIHCLSDGAAKQQLRKVFVFAKTKQKRLFCGQSWYISPNFL